MKTVRTFAIAVLGLTCAMPLAHLHAQPQAIEPSNYDKLHVGDNGGGRSVVPTNQVVSPLGEQVVVRTRVTALAISPNGRWLAGLGHDEIVVIDLDSTKVVGTAAMAGSFTGIVFAPDGKLYASDIRGMIEVYAVGADGTLKKASSIHLPGSKSKTTNPAPAGLALDPGGKTLWAVLNMKNSVVEIELASGRVLREISVGNAPLDVVCAGGQVLVSNWAGRRPAADSVIGPSGRGASVRVDPRAHIASDGSVSVVDPSKGRATKEIVVGAHSSGLAASPDGHYVCVANANADTVSVIDLQREEVVETISTRPAPELLLGSAPNALAFDPTGRTLFVSNGTNNAVAVIAFAPGKSRLLCCLPAGWYPSGLVFDQRRQTLCVANIKGSGARSPDGIGTMKGTTLSGYNSKKAVGSVSLIRLPKEDELARHTATVLANNRLAEARLAQARPRPDARPRPIPERHGEPSVFKHVLYIIKENRTYDQVFGDMPEGNGDRRLCIFGENVTPNHHRLAREFVLLDNFYCSGVLSADGHQWTDEAYATDYIEKSFGGWPRSYPYDGADAMAYARSGFLWDNVLARDKRLRVYGEFVHATIRWKDPKAKGKPGFIDCYRDYVAKTGRVEIRATAAIRTLEPHICPTVTGFPLLVCDQYRADQFLAEFREFERRDQVPHLMMMLLPCDHTSATKPGMPTPAAAVADNDLALGRIIEAISHSKSWKETCVFVVEDDPQNGFDHIDGHRTVALVVSPYTRRHVVDSTNYNQTSIVRSIESILGLPPMNQIDSAATPMASCFTDRLDATPYSAIKNNIPLDQLNRGLSQIKDPAQRHWAEVSIGLPLDECDEADEDTMNRILWHAQRGRDDTYPTWAVLDRDNN